MASGRVKRAKEAEAALSELFELMYRGEKGKHELCRLMESYGSASAVIEAGMNRLMYDGMSEDTAMLISILPDIVRHMDEAEWGNHPKLRTLIEAEKYMRFKYLGKNIENYHMLALDSSGKLIECVHLHSGNEDSVPFYLRNVMSEAVRTHAEAIVLCHNHPNCTTRPSLADIECTRKLMRAAAHIGAPVVDHMIMVGGKAVSMRGFGFIPECEWTAQSSDSVIMKNWLNDWDFEDAADELSKYGK